MKRSRIVLAAVIAVLAAVLGFSSPALAAPAGAQGWHFSEGYACTYLCSGTVFVDVHTYNTAWQIWVNGRVSCAGYNGTHVTWCGVGGGNGSGVLDTGANYTFAGHSYWFRLDLRATGVCLLRGDASSEAWTYCFALP